MSDKVFLDTNTLIYAYSVDEPLKKKAIEKVIESSHEIILSTQVVNEFINVMSKKRKVGLPELAITVDELADNFSVAQITLQTIKQALMISQKYQYSYFDSLIISSALEHSCSVLYTEDMHNEQLIEGKLRIKNPFFKL
ncbi:PIN domain-containing protein [Candidatus Dependentiae bacterium]|nr:PIN domain-containing protein [Candidatus Dependentiae bacterium]